MGSMNIDVLNKKVIKPSDPTPSDLANLNLSLFDQLAPHKHTPVIFYYLCSDHDSDSNTMDSAKRICQLEKSLSRTLNMFYPLAGRYSAKDMCIECHDQGVEWFETRVNGKLREFLDDTKTEILDQFLPWKSPPASHLITSPILGVKINRFDCGGIVLGMSFSHTIADASTITRFTMEWAINNRKGIHPPLCENRSYNEFTALFPSVSSLSLTDEDLINEDNEFIAKRFCFHEKITSDVREEVSPLLNFRSTRVVIIMALVWKAIIVVSKAKQSNLKNSMLGFSMNLREKQQSFKPTELNYGNFWMLVPVFFNASEDKLELQHLIYLISNKIRETKQKLANASPNEISLMVIESTRLILKRLQESNDLDNYFVSSWCNFPLSKVDFGWGNPTWVSSATTQNYVVTWLMDAINGDGIEAWVNLKKEDMTQFEKILVSCTNHV